MRRAIIITLLLAVSPALALDRDAPFGLAAAEQQPGPVDAVREAMRKLMPGIEAGEAERLLRVDTFRLEYLSAQPWGSAFRYRVGNAHSLTLAFRIKSVGRDLKSELSGATLRRGDQVIAELPADK